MEKNNRKTYALGYQRARLLEVLIKAQSKKESLVRQEQVEVARQLEDSTPRFGVLDLDNLVVTRRLKRLSYHDGNLVIEATL